MHFEQVGIEEAVGDSVVGVVVSVERNLNRQHVRFRVLRDAALNMLVVDHDTRHVDQAVIVSEPHGYLRAVILRADEVSA